MITFAMPFLINKADVRSNKANAKDEIALLEEKIKN